MLSHTFNLAHPKLVRSEMTASTKKNACYESNGLGCVVEMGEDSVLTFKGGFPFVGKIDGKICRQKLFLRTKHIRLFVQENWVFSFANLLRLDAQSLNPLKNRLWVYQAVAVFKIKNACIFYEMC